MIAIALVGCQAEEAAESTASTQTMPVDVLSEGGTVEPPPITVDLAQLGFDIGDPGAPIKVVEFSDFGCGYCRQFHTETLPTVMQEFIDAGQVEWKYVTYVSGMFPNGLPAAFAGECAGAQGKFEAMSDLLYSRQSEWKPEDDPQPVFDQLAADAGLNVREFQACIAEERPKDRIRSGIMLGARLGVRGTPSFLIDGYPLVGAQPLTVWRDIFNARLAELAAGQ